MAEEQGLHEDLNSMLHCIKNFPVVLKMVIYTLEKMKKQDRKKFSSKVEATDVQDNE